MKCCANNCDRDIYAVGLCQMHYKRKRLGKDPNTKSQKQLTPLEKFEQKYTINEAGCWEWKYKKPDGRANTFLYNKKPQSAYRASYQMFKGPIPDGMYVCHSCDNGLCVNPDHLWLGTQKDNIRDMHEKDRHSKAKGEQRGKVAKLTEMQVREIKASPLNQHQLAKEYGVSRATIGDIINKRTWAHVE